MIFLLFDIEVAILGPWAMALRDLGWPGFVQILVFFVILAVALCTSGGRACWIGGREAIPTTCARPSRDRRRQEIRLWRLETDLPGDPGSHHHPRESGAVEPALGHLAGDLRPRRCAIEMMAMASSRYDISRFGAEVFRGSPRQSGSDDHRRASLPEVGPGAAPHLRPVPRPKWVISMARARACGGVRQRTRSCRARPGRADRRLTSPVVRRVPKPCSTGSSCCRRRSTPRRCSRMDAQGHSIC